MGILDLNQIIKCAKYIEKVKFKNQRIALDFLNFWYINHSKACKDEVSSLPIALLKERKHDSNKILERTSELYREDMINFCRFQILPVTIFEGKAFDHKNKYAAVRRKKTRDRAKEMLEELEEKTTLNEAETKRYRNLYVQTIGFDKNEVTKRVKEMLDSVGLPWLHCVTEAEHLCAALCREGYVIASYTTDTDIYTLKCPFTINKEGSEEEPQAPFYKTVAYKDILQTNNFTPEQFVDVCILSSCDYNERIKIKTKTGKIKPIGLKTGIKLIQEHGSLDEIIKKEELINLENLEITACKDIFRSFNVKELCPDFMFEKLQVRKIKDAKIEDTLISLLQHISSYIPQYIWP